MTDDYYDNRMKELSRINGNNPLLPEDELLILDRNILSLIQAYLEGKFHYTESDSTEQRKNKKYNLSKINKLKALDQSNKHVTPLLSVIEGELIREQTKEEALSLYYKESRYIFKFFKKANLWGNTFFPTKISQSFNYNENWDNQKNFLEDVRAMISLLSLPKKELENAKNKVLELAEKNNLKKTNMIVFFVLSGVYGNINIQRVIGKKGKKTAYNALNDLNNLAYVLFFIGQYKQLDYKANIDFYTDDDALKKAWNNIKTYKYETHIYKDQVFLPIEKMGKIFPNIGKRKYAKLLKELDN